MNVIMRPYELKDIEQIVALVQEHVPKLPNYKNITIAPDRLSYLLRHNHGNASYFQAWVLVTDDNKIVGGVAGYCTQGMLTWQYIASDSFLFIIEEYRSLKRAVALVNAYKKWALARGATLVTASVRGGYRPEEFDRFMKRLGFSPVGTIYHLRNDEGHLSEQLEALRTGA